MEYSNLEEMKRFGENHLPDLDVVVLAALELFMERKVPCLDLARFKKPLVVGSGNAAATGRILLEKSEAVFADESTYSTKLASACGIDGAILISASGKKHAVSIGKDLKERGYNRRLLTCNPKAPAAEHFESNQVLVFPKNREPYTYNTSTYMSMILAVTGEDPGAIHDFMLNQIAPRVPGDKASRYDPFALMVPPALDSIREMFLTKFDELFGPLVSARVFTFEQTKHAKTVVGSKRELFMSLGCDNGVFGHERARLQVPLPPNAGYGAIMAIGYYVIGRLQS